MSNGICCHSVPLTSLLLEGLESEESELLASDFQDIREEAIARFKRRKKLDS